MTTPAQTSEPGRGAALAGRVKTLELQEYALAIVVVLLFVVGAILKPDTFPTVDNVRNMLTQPSVVGVLAIGMTFVIATAGIDLSVGSIVAAAGVFGGILVGDNGLRSDDHPDRARHRADRLQPVRELRARRLEGRSDGSAQLLDVAAGTFLALSPWLFGFADESANVWVPHLVVGLAAIFLGLTTIQQGYSYRRSPTTAAG